MLDSDTLIGNVTRIAESQPNKVFAKLLFCGRESVVITYQDLLTNAAKFASFYKSKGIDRNDVVVILLNHGAELLYSFVGALLYGAVPSIFAPPSVKISTEEYGRTLSLLLDVCDTRYLLTFRELSQQLQGIYPQETIDILIAEEGLGYLPAVEWACSDPTEIVLLQHSSGTTGLKKGVALSNRSVINQLRNYVSTLKLNEDDKIVSWLPLYHDMGLIA